MPLPLGSPRQKQHGIAHQCVGKRITPSVLSEGVKTLDCCKSEFSSQFDNTSEVLKFCEVFDVGLFCCAVKQHGPFCCPEHYDAPMFTTRNLGLVPYREAYQLQLETHAKVANKELPPTLLLLEHPRVVTHGRKDEDDTNLVVPKSFLEAQGIEVIATERGGTVTYHGPGQLVGYAIFPVHRRVRDFLRRIEDALVLALKDFAIQARPNPDYAGVYVQDAPDGTKQKIASIGVAVRQNVALHGFALNIYTNLQDFELIVPCGLAGTRMVSLESLGVAVGMEAVKDAVDVAFKTVFKDYSFKND